MFFFLKKWRLVWQLGEWIWSQRWSNMAFQIHEKNGTGKICQNDGQRVEKAWNIEPKWLPKSWTIHTKIDFEKSSNNHRTNKMKWRCRTLKLIGFPKEKHTFHKNQVFWTGSNKSLKSHRNSCNKSMNNPLTNLYKIEVPRSIGKLRQHDRKRSENGTQRDPKSWQHLCKLRGRKKLEFYQKTPAQA